MRFSWQRRNWGMLLLGVWLILTGAAAFGLTFTRLGDVLAGLAIVAGVLIVLDR